MVTKAYYTERPDSIKYMSLPSADTADLWMRKNIAEVTDPETGAKSYEADEAYMRTTATEAEITANFDAWYEKASAWQPPVPPKKPTQEGRITALEAAVEKLKQGTGTPADVSKIEQAVAELKAENQTLANELRAAKIVLGVE